MVDEATARDLAKRLRIDSIRATSAAGSGHPTSAMSAADLMAVLQCGHLHYDFDSPDDPNNDHLIFSKGHAAPLLYAMFRAAGAITDAELLSLRKHGSRLQGHPTPALPWVDVATGSLGQGLPIGVGIALAGKRLDQLPYRVWVLCGDSEMSEGSIWEAMEQAGHARLDNLVCILDTNRLGQRGPTMHGWDLAAFTRRARAFGWQALAIDGHDLSSIENAYVAAEAADGRPTMIVARTRKGRGASETEDVEGKHGQPLEDPERAIAEIGDVGPIKVVPPKPKGRAIPHRFTADGSVRRPRYPLDGDAVATRRAFGETAAALVRRRGDVVVLDGEVGNSTYLELARAAAPERHFQMFIAEQQLVASAVGFQVRGWRPILATFAAFLTRAYDFIRMAAISEANLCICGTHAGVSIGEDGPSQMAIEDIAALRAITGSTVLYPSDPNQAAALLEQMIDLPGISYLRATRAALPTLYEPDEEFPIGGAKVLRQSDADQVTLVAAGYTLHEALLAAGRLAREGISARVIDLYSVKPLDFETLRTAAQETDGRFVTVEDHRPEGGLGSAVLDAFADSDLRPRVVKLAVSDLPGSGTPEELLAASGIDAQAIVEAAKRIVVSRGYGRPPAGVGVRTMERRYGPT
jgi:transketolase